MSRSDILHQLDEKPFRPVRRRGPRASCRYLAGWSVDTHYRSASHCWLSASGAPRDTEIASLRREGVLLTVLIPALNEQEAIGDTVDQIRSVLNEHRIEHEVIVINDGSTDDTGRIAAEKGARVLDHPRPGGYGKALKDGCAIARYDLIAITDADGTYPNEFILQLYKLVVERRFDMAVGARTGKEYRGTFLKMPARRVFLWLSEYAAGQKIDDINSGLRVFRRDLALRHIHTISNGFSFTTTITLAAMLNGYFVTYVPIPYHKRVGASHVRYWRDSWRTLQIIVESILYYNPLKLFLLAVNALVALSVASVVGYFLLPGAGARALLAAIGAAALVGSVVVGALGLVADLFRIAVKSTTPWTETRDLHQCVSEPLQRDEPSDAGEN